MLIRTFRHDWSQMKILGWREDLLHSKWREIPWLRMNREPDPVKWKKLTFREAIKKLSTFEMKRGMLYYLGPEEWSFLEKEFGMNVEQIGGLNDDEARDFWEKLSEAAEPDSLVHETVEEIIQNAISWAVPLWDIPEWMTEW